MLHKYLDQIGSLKQAIEESRQQHTTLLEGGSPLRRRIRMHQEIQELRKKCLQEIKEEEKAKTKAARHDIEISIQVGESVHTTDFVDRSRKEVLILLREFKEII